MTRYVIQQSRDQIVSIGLENIDRLDVNMLYDCLTYPVVWSYDEYLSSWLVSEITEDLANWLKTYYQSGVINANDERLWSITRKKQLLRAGILSPTGRIIIEQLFVDRRANKLVKIPQLLAAEYAEWLKEFFDRVQMSRFPEMHGISRDSINDHPLMRLIHSQLLHVVERICALPLKPSYSFTAVYDNNSNLPEHTDREQCLMNISLLFGGSPKNASLRSWPLFVRVDGRVHALELEPGDGGLYSGTAHKHWRDKMPASLETVSGAFLHYVRRDFQGKLT